MVMADYTTLQTAAGEVEYFRYENDKSEIPAKCITAAFRDIQKRATTKRCRFPEPRLCVELTWRWNECSARRFACNGRECDECPHYKDAARNFEYVAGAVEHYSGDAMVVPLGFIGGIIQDLPRHAHNALMMEAKLSIRNIDTNNTGVKCESLVDSGCDTIVEIDSSEIRPVKRILKQLGLLGRSTKLKGGD